MEERDGGDSANVGFDMLLFGIGVRGDARSCVRY